jgi:hypothetical protein
MAPEANQAAVTAGSGEIPVPNGTPEVPACVGTVCYMPQCRKTVNDKLNCTRGCIGAKLRKMDGELSFAVTCD